MNINEFIIKLDAVHKLLSVRLADEMKTRIGVDIVADIEDRIINTGQKASGGLFSSYNKEYAEWKSGKKGGGATAFKNFELTGQMWTDFKVIKSKSAAGNITTEIGFTSKTQLEKAEANSKRENGSIIKPSSKEIKSAKKRIEKYVIKEINRLL